MRFMFCTAWPTAPFRRLSIAEVISSLLPYFSTWTRALLVLTTCFRSVGEGSAGIELLVGFDDILHWGWCLDDGCAEDASRKVATIGDKVYIGIEIALNLFQRLTDLSDVLVLERLVDAQVVVAPREVGRGPWLLTSACRTCDGIDGYIFFQQIEIGSRQQGHLNASSETAWISDMLGFLDVLLVNLGQTVNIVVIALDSEVLCQVDNLDVSRDGVLFEECLALAMSETEEYDIHLIKRHLVGKLQVCVTNQAFVDIADKVACVTF